MNKSILEKRPHLIPCSIAAVMLLLALAPWPYGYYQLLRFIVCGISIYVAFIAYNWHKIWATWLFGFIAVLFNPLIPIHLSREFWKLIDGLCGFVFIVVTIMLKGRIPSVDKNRGETK
jgi:hypothetical protein